MADRFPRASYLRPPDAEALVASAIEDSILVRDLAQLIEQGKARAQVIGTVGGELLVNVYRVGLEPVTLKYRGEE